MNVDLEQYSDDIVSIDELFPRGKLFRLAFDAKVGKMKIFSCDHQAFEDLRSAFSAENASCFFVKQYGYNPDSKVYVINKFGYFSLGLTFDILSWLKSTYGSLDCLALSHACRSDIEDYLTPLRSKFKGLDANSFELANVSEDSGRNKAIIASGKKPYLFRDYQANAIKFLLFKGYGRGLIELPTGSGKSAVIANFIWNTLKLVNPFYKTLILVPNKQLVEQFYKDMLDYGYKETDLTRFTAGMKGKDAFNKDAKIIIANRQYIFSNLEKLPKVDILVADEAHQAVAESTSNFIEQLNCKIKVGCSGSLPRDPYKKWLLIGLFSKIVYTEGIVKLQDEGYISKLKITVLRIQDQAIENDRNILFNMHTVNKYHADDPTDILFNDAYNAELDYFNKNYSSLYSPVLSYLSKLEENILVLFDRIEVGKNIFSLAKDLMPNKDVLYIDGLVAINEREKIRAKLESSGTNILFAQSTVFSTGINITRLNHIVFLFNTKSFSRVLQSIGRTLRLHKSKSEAHLIDIVYNYKYSSKHFKERLDIYKKMYNKPKPDEVIKLTI